MWLGNQREWGEPLLAAMEDAPSQEAQCGMDGNSAALRNPAQDLLLNPVALLIWLGRVTPSNHLHFIDKI